MDPIGPAVRSDLCDFALSVVAGGVEQECGAGARVDVSEATAATAAGRKQLVDEAPQQSQVGLQLAVVGLQLGDGGLQLAVIGLQLGAKWK